MLLQVHHETVYRYAETVRYAIQVLHLTPRREALQRIVAWNIQTPGRRTEQIDAHGNVVHFLTVETPHRELRLTVAGIVETDATEGQPNCATDQLSPLVYRTTTALTAADGALTEFANTTIRDPATERRSQILKVAEAVAGRVRYRPGSSQVSDAAVAVFSRGEGVCQDQAQVFIACCRAIGWSARYVSGYLHAGTDDNVASHAWAEVWLEDAGCWYGIDITSGRPVGPNHCRVAVGRDYLDAAPIRGMRRGGGEEQMQVAVLVSDAPQQ